MRSKSGDFEEIFVGNFWVFWFLNSEQFWLRKNECEMLEWAWAWEI